MTESFKCDKIESFSSGVVTSSSSSSFQPVRRRGGANTLETPCSRFHGQRASRSCDLDICRVRSQPPYTRLRIFFFAFRSSFDPSTATRLSDRGADVGLGAPTKSIHIRSEERRVGKECRSRG